MLFITPARIVIDENNRKTSLFKYTQLIEIDKNEDEKSNNNISQTLFSIKYFLFPKLLFDHKFFNINYNIYFILYNYIFQFFFLITIKIINNKYLIYIFCSNIFCF